MQGHFRCLYQNIYTLISFASNAKLIMAQAHVSESQFNFENLYFFKTENFFKYFLNSGLSSEDFVYVDIALS